MHAVLQKSSLCISASDGGHDPERKVMSKPRRGYTLRRLCRIVEKPVNPLFHWAKLPSRCMSSGGLGVPPSSYTAFSFVSTHAP